MPAYAIVSNYAGKVIDHQAYAANVRTMSDAELLFTARDAKATVDAWPDQPNAGYYLDEINYCAGELHRRRQGGQRDTRPVSDCGGFILADDQDHDPDAIVLEADNDAPPADPWGLYKATQARLDAARAAAGLLQSVRRTVTRTSGVAGWIQTRNEMPNSFRAHAARELRAARAEYDAA
jgi:hypothetical protein